jgi:peptide/nickel transport system permease protein
MTSRRFLIRRLIMLAGSLLVASFIIFGSMYLAPGSALAALTGGRALPASSIAVLEQRYHLNQSFFAQYWYWLGNALHGNLGISIEWRENVTRLIGNLSWTTMGLVLYASVIIVVVGIGLGIASGLKPGGKLDTSVLVSTAVTAALPSFVASMVRWNCTGSRRLAMAPVSCPTCSTSPCRPSRWPSHRWPSSPG